MWKPGSFVIYNAQGFDIGVEEARYQLGTYGAMSKCELLHPHILEALKLSSGVLVEFTTFDPSRDVVSVSKAWAPLGVSSRSFLCLHDP